MRSQQLAAPFFSFGTWNSEEMLEEEEGARLGTGQGLVLEAEFLHIEGGCLLGRDSLFPKAVRFLGAAMAVRVDRVCVGKMVTVVKPSSLCTDLERCVLVATTSQFSLRLRAKLLIKMNLTAPIDLAGRA
jgi:hypothetical protein